MSIQACAELVLRADPDRFLSAMAAPVAARAVLFPLYALNVEVARAPWVTAEPMIAEMRLQWWRDALEEIGKGGAVRHHEVVTPLVDILDADAAETLDALVVARRWDVYRDPFEDGAAFDSYIDQTAGNLMWTAARLLGATDPAPIRDLAYASGLANWLLAIPELEARGRLPLVDGRAEAIEKLAVHGLMRLRAAQARRAHIPKSAAPALLAGWRAGAILKQAARQPARVADAALGQSEFTRRGGVLVRSLRGRW